MSVLPKLLVAGSNPVARSRVILLNLLELLLGMSRDPLRCIREEREHRGCIRAGPGASRLRPHLRARGSAHYSRGRRTNAWALDRRFHRHCRIHNNHTALMTCTSHHSRQHLHRFHRVKQYSNCRTAGRRLRPAENAHSRRRRSRLRQEQAGVVFSLPSPYCLTIEAHPWSISPAVTAPRHTFRTVPSAFTRTVFGTVVM